MGAMKIHPRLRRLASVGSRFLVVGALSTIIEIAVFNLLVYALGVDVVWGKIIASLVALINAYFGNREWTFRNRDRRGRQELPDPRRSGLPGNYGVMELDPIWVSRAGRLRSVVRDRLIVHPLGRAKRSSRSSCPPRAPSG